MSLNILLIGDSCIDVYIRGKVTRLSPEAPVPIFQPIGSSMKLGMASNVANNLTALGCNVDLVTNKDKGLKTRYIDNKSGQHLLRMDEEAWIEPWDNKLPEFTNYDVVVISDYNKGFLSYEQIESIIECTQVPVFVDTKKPDLIRFNKAIVKINEQEASLSISKCENLIVTYGSSHVSFNDKQYPVPKVPVFDVCGAGDTFLAALAYKYGNTKQIKEASAITVQHLGVYSPSLKELNVD